LTSIVDVESRAGEKADRRALIIASAAFMALLVLAISWPDPVVWLNSVTFKTALAVDDESFLGREAPSWDVAYWAIAGLVLLRMLEGRRESLREGGVELRTFATNLPGNARALMREIGAIRITVASILLALVVGLTWFFLDAPVVAACETVVSPVARSFVRWLNRLGGGMNPPMIMIFYLVAGMLFRRPVWIQWALAMVATGLSGGVLIHVLKILVGRSRPELWLGAFHHVGPSSSSFPSGHTMGAFAIGAVLFFGSKSWPFRIAALLLAGSVASSRVVAFRHWPSDVVASALLGMLLGWFFLRAGRSEQRAGGRGPTVNERSWIESDRRSSFNRKSQS